MSWSVSVVGKPAAVAAKVAKELAAVKCSEPEEEIKNSVASIVATALGAFPEGAAVKVNASGSQYSPNNDGKKVNNLSVSIEPLYGFVE